MSRERTLRVTLKESLVASHAAPVCLVVNTRVNASAMLVLVTPLVLSLARLHDPVVTPVQHLATQVYLVLTLLVRHR